MRQVKKGSTNVSVDVYIIDSTNGTPETGVLWNTAGMDMEYRREGAAVVDITVVTLAALTTAHTDGGFLEIGHGLYRLDVPDAAFATGANTVSIQGTVTGMIVLPQTIQLVDFDPGDGVRLGLTALPNAAANAAGGLPISNAGGLDLDTKLANTNEVTAARMGALTDWIDGGRLDLILDIIAADVVNIDGAAMRGTDGALTDKNGYALSTAGILAVWHQALTAIVTAGSIGKLLKDEITAARMAVLTDWIDGGRLDLLLDAIPTTPMRGTDSAALASVCTEARLAELDAANLPTDVANVKTDTAAILVDTGTTLDARIPAALVGGRMDSDIGAKTGNVGLTAQEKLDVNTEVDNALDTDIPVSPTAGSVNDILENMKRAAKGLVVGKAITGTLSTTQATTDLTETTDDHYNGRLLTFTTGVLAGQQTDITDYTGATKLLTFTAMTEAPANNDEFVIQ